MNDPSDSIERTVHIKAPVSRVWRALTDYQEFGEWFRVKLDGPFVPGKRSSGYMTYPGYEGMKWLAFIEKMESESVFSFRWEVDESEDKMESHMTLVVFTLVSADDGCDLTVVESGFGNLPPDKRLDIFRSNVEGWKIQTGNTADYVIAHP